MPLEPLTMVDLEKKLLYDHDGSCLLGLEEKLKLSLDQVLAKKRTGVPPVEFKALEQFGNAIESAMSIIRKYWQFYHPEEVMNQFGAKKTKMHIKK